MEEEEDALQARGKGGRGIQSWVASEAKLHWVKSLTNSTHPLSIDNVISLGGLLHKGSPTAFTNFGLTTYHSSRDLPSRNQVKEQQEQI